MPLVVNGTLLLSNVRTNNAIWLNAIPVNEAPSSSSWKNSAVQQSVMNGDTIDPQFSRTSNWQNLEGGSSPCAPAFAELNGVIYAAVQGENNGLLWSSSKDGGQSWQGWQQITNAYSSEYSTTTIPPSLAAYEGFLYLSYAYGGKLFIQAFDGLDWTVFLPSVAEDTRGNYFSVQSASLVVEGDRLSVYYVDEDGYIYRTSTNDPISPVYSYWEDGSPILSPGGRQASSGNLSVARFNNQTYIAYPYGYANRLTTSADPGTASSWSLLTSANGVPQPINTFTTLYRPPSAVGLSANNLGLVLS